jgi:hypothetical protein
MISFSLFVLSRFSYIFPTKPSVFAQNRLSFDGWATLEDGAWVGCSSPPFSFGGQ